MYDLDLSLAQTRREVESDQRAEEWAFATLEIAELVRVWGKAAIEAELTQYANKPPQQKWGPQCSQCVNWQLSRALERADGTIFNTPSYCRLRGDSELDQMPQDYASRCHFYEPNCPF